jgi:hypothetical protein
MQKKKKKKDKGLPQTRLPLQPSALYFLLDSACILAGEEGLL